MAGVHSSKCPPCSLSLTLDPCPFLPSAASVPPLSYIPGYDTCKSWSEDANCADPSKSVKIQKCTISYDVRMQLQQEQSQEREATGAVEVAIVAPCSLAPPVANGLRPSPLRSGLTIFYSPCVLCSCFRCHRASRASSCMPNSVPTSFSRRSPIPTVTRSHR